MILDLSKHKADRINLHDANNITFLRHLAAVLVLISHSYGLLGRHDEEPLFVVSGSSFNFSYIGLVFFFFLSGFLVTGSFLASKNFKDFLVKRILRIFPALFILILFTVFLIGPLFTVLSVKDYFLSLETWMYFLGGITLVKLRFFLPGVFNENGVNGSLWSLPIEFRFYLFLALLLFITRIKKNNKSGIIVLVFVACCILNMLLEPLLALTILKPYLDWIGYFFLGSVAFLYKEIIRLRIVYLAVFFAFWISCINIDGLNTLISFFFLSYLCLFLAFKTFLVAPHFFKENDYSYSIYIYAFLIQQILIHLASGFFVPSTLTIATLIVLLPLSYASWTYIEKPVLRWKKYKFE